MPVGRHRRGRRPRRPSPRARAVRWGLAVVLGGLALLGGLAALALQRAATDLRGARDDLRTVDALVADGRLGDAEARLDAAFAKADRANRTLHGSLALDLVGALPVVRQNVDSLQRSVGDGLRLVDGGRRVLQVAAPLQDGEGRMEVPLRSGEIPVATVVRVRRELLLAASELPRTGERDGGSLLVGPVRELAEDITEESDRRADQFQDVAHALQVVEELAGADGDRRFLIAVANPAEMRGTGGMVLSYGTLESSGGRFHLGSFGRIDEIKPPGPLPAEEVDLPEDYLRRWAGFDVTQRWRNVTMTADLPTVGPTMLDLYRHATGQEAHGVIQVDPVGLAAILEGTGPVEVPELGRVTAENVVDLTLNEAYVRFPDVEQRSDVLGDVAEAVFDRLVSGEYPSLRPLGEALLDTVAGRHLAMYSSTPRIQAVLGLFGATAALPEPTAEHVHLGVQNVSGNKLDYYLDSSLALTGTRPGGEEGRVRATVTLVNRTPAGATEPRYVLGPFNDDQRAGLYRGIVTLYLPRGATLAGVAGHPVVHPPAVAAEAGRTVVSYTVAVPAQGRSEVVLDLRLPPRPDGDYALLATPSGRVRPTALAVDLDTGDGRVRQQVALDRPRSLAPGDHAPRDS